MAPHKTVSINGRQYDSVTGLPIKPVEVLNPDKTPVKKPKPAPAPAKKPAPRVTRGTTTSEVIAGPQRSQTLNRRVAKKPAAPQKVVTKRATPGRHMDIARSANVAKFAKNPEVKAPAPKPAVAAAASKPVTKPAPKPLAKPAQKASKPAKPAKADRPARVHPIAQRAAHRKAVKPAAPQTAKDVKEAAISKALATPAVAPVKSKSRGKKNSWKNNKTLRRALLIAAAIVAVLAVAYAVYRLVPNISVSVAASQAGISATYPEFTPDGYALSHPVTYTDGEVDLKFDSNSNNNYYTITQTRSSWDSSAVLDNIVTPVAGANYVTTKERGLTIYTYGSSAAWVNGGILYKIESKAPLSGDQIRKIATSL
ncbi:MAG: hypothetical protein ACREGE_04285 [Candidatus Microsaccharimonas sp.]